MSEPIDELARDLTQAHPMPKSEVRQRLVALIQRKETEAGIETYDIKAIEHQAKAEAYADCASKSGSGTEVRAYAKSRANGYAELHRRSEGGKV